jgi:transposase-like protein
LKIFTNIIASSFENREIKIGGPGIEVQLDESKFGKRKYNRGHHVEGAWVFGGVEVTQERKFFALVVENRNANTLNELIKKFVLPGSVVITDGWKGHSLFKRDPSFTHYCVIHAIGFKILEGKHTNHIEGTWSGLKSNVPVMCRVIGRLQGKLFEFIWRRENKANLWEKFLELLRC